MLTKAAAGGPGPARFDPTQSPVLKPVSPGRRRSIEAATLPSLAEVRAKAAQSKAAPPSGAGPRAPGLPLTMATGAAVRAHLEAVRPVLDAAQPAPDATDDEIRALRRATIELREDISLAVEKIVPDARHPDVAEQYRLRFEVATDENEVATGEKNAAVTLHLSSDAACVTGIETPAADPGALDSLVRAGYLRPTLCEAFPTPFTACTLRIEELPPLPLHDLFRSPRTIRADEACTIGSADPSNDCVHAEVQAGHMVVALVGTQNNRPLVVGLVCLSDPKFLSQLPPFMDRLKALQAQRVDAAVIAPSACAKAAESAARSAGLGSVRVHEPPGASGDFPQVASSGFRVVVDRSGTIHVGRMPTEVNAGPAVAPEFDIPNAVKVLPGARQVLACEGSTSAGLYAEVDRSSLALVAAARDSEDDDDLRRIAIANLDANVGKQALVDFLVSLDVGRCKAVEVCLLAGSDERLAFAQEAATSAGAAVVHSQRVPPEGLRVGIDPEGGLYYSPGIGPGHPDEGAQPLAPLALPPAAAGPGEASSRAAQSSPSPSGRGSG